MAEVRQIKQEALANQRVIDQLEELLARAKAGEVNALLTVCESRGHRYEYSRSGFTYPEALGLLSRAMYDLHKCWDEKS